jgi:hypothetical protein
MKSTRIAAIAAISSLAGGLLATAAGASFHDVNEASRAGEHITNVQESGIASGYADGTFRPSNALTRQAGATWIDRAATRIDADQFSDGLGALTITDGQTVTVAEIEMSSPAAASGGGWVNISGGVGARLQSGGESSCPCQVQLLVKDSSDEIVGISAVTVTPDGLVSTGPVMAVAPLAGGQTETYRVELTLVDGGDAVVAVGGAVSAIYAPITDGDPEQVFDEGAGDAVVNLVPEG